MRPRAPTVVALAHRAQRALEEGIVLYPVVAEHAILATSAERNPTDDGQPRGIGGISDPTGGEAMREVCRECDGTAKRRHRAECPACEGRRHLDVGGEKVDCARCDRRGTVNQYGPEPCTECDGGWQFTESQGMERACDRYWVAINLIIAATEGLAKMAPELANGVSQVNGDVATGKRRRTGERFEGQRRGFKCLVCGVVVPRLKQRICVAYATDPAERDAETGRYVPSADALANNCYYQWTVAFGKEGISIKDWIRREQVVRAGQRKVGSAGSAAIERAKQAVQG